MTRGQPNSGFCRSTAPHSTRCHGLKIAPGFFGMPGASAPVLSSPRTNLTSVPALLPRPNRSVPIACAISLFVCAWLVTWGDWKFFEHDALSSFYDAQALSILTGHLDVPRQAIGFEAYLFHGKAYGYFGIGPALLRIPLLICFPHLDGLWARSMMMIASILALICAYRILMLTRRNLEQPAKFQHLLTSLFLLNAAIGSTNLFIIGRTCVFHEAIIWGSTFALLFAWTLLRYFESPSRSLLALCGLSAFFSFHSRATAGAGALLGLCLLAAVLVGRTLKNRDLLASFLGFRAVSNPLPHALIAIGWVGLTLSTYFGVNYAKFHTFSSMPLRYYDLYVEAPARMEVTGARQIHPENIPTTVATYFGLPGCRFDRHFPWVGLTRKPTILGSPRIDVVEPFSTFPGSMPALTLLALIGSGLIVRGSSEKIRRIRLPAAALVAGGGVVLMTVGITERYLHDFYPALILCAAAGVCGMASKQWMPGKAILLASLTIASIAINCSFAIVNQRLGPWGVPPEKRAEFVRLQDSVDNWLGQK